MASAAASAPTSIAFECGTAAFVEIDAETASMNSDLLDADDVVFQGHRLDVDWPLSETDSQRVSYTRAGAWTRAQLLWSMRQTIRRLYRHTGRGVALHRLVYQPAADAWLPVMEAV